MAEKTAFYFMVDWLAIIGSSKNIKMRVCDNYPTILISRHYHQLQLEVRNRIDC